MAHINLTPEVTEILRTAEFQGTSLRIREKLDPKIYASVKKAVLALGGKWIGGKTQAHVFPTDAREIINAILSSGTIEDKKKTRQAYYTPHSVADEIAIMAHVQGREVLEPSAGDGSLVTACYAHGAARVTAIEIEPTCQTSLQHSKAHEVIIGDFLLQPPNPVFDRVVMNPPFAKGQAVKHILHALRFLVRGGALVAIVPDKDHPQLADFGAALVLKRYPEKTFKESGTNIATRVIGITKP